jgi:hypothetical protein
LLSRRVKRLLTILQQHDLLAAAEAMSNLDLQSALRGRALDGVEPPLAGADCMRFRVR